MSTTYLVHSSQSFILNWIGQAGQFLDFLPQIQIHSLPLIVTHRPRTLSGQALFDSRQYRADQSQKLRIPVHFLLIQHRFVVDLASGRSHFQSPTAEHHIQSSDALIAATRLIRRQRGTDAKEQIFQPRNVPTLTVAERQKSIAGDQTGKMIGDVRMGGVDDVADRIFDGNGPAAWSQQREEIVTVENDVEYNFRRLQTE